jgi:hypothetical protein
VNMSATTAARFAERDIQKLKDTATMQKLNLDELDELEELEDYKFKLDELIIGEQQRQTRLARIRAEKRKLADRMN